MVNCTSNIDGEFLASFNAKSYLCSNLFDRNLLRTAVPIDKWVPVRHLSSIMRNTLLGIPVIELLQFLMTFGDVHLPGNIVIVIDL
jgi:hypothetical protein